VSVGFIGWDRYLFSRQLAAPLLVPVPLPAETNISGFDFGADGYYWLSTKTQGPGRLVGLNTLYRTTLSPVATAAFNTDDVRRSQLKVTPSSFYFFETTFSDPNQMQPTRWALKRRDRTTGVEATLGPETVTATPARFTDTHVAWRTSSDLWVQALASGNRRTLSRGTGGTFQAVGLGRDAAYLARGNTVFRGPITVERLSLSTGAVTPFWSYQDPNGRSLFTDVAVLGRCVVAGINGDAGGALGGGRIVVIGEDP
jgi:hypothetical protein